MSTFTKIQQDIEEGISDGLSDAVRRAALAKREEMVTKLTVGNCKSMESYADAVGVIRGLDHILTFEAEKRRKAQVELSDETREDD